LYFDINILLAFNGEKLINDTISTNIPKIEHTILRILIFTL
jgi:hypothetical protein